MNRPTTAPGPYLPGSTRPRLPATRPPMHDWRASTRIWWREVDRVLLGLIVTLMAMGTIAVAAASPASAQRLSTAAVELDSMFFFWAHIRWQLVGLVVMVGTSMVAQENARRGAIVLCAVMMGALVLVPLIGAEVNGARRWINLGMRFQPSEFLKPAFAVTLAWVLSWRLRDPTMPVVAISAVLFAIIAALLMVQPNLGDTILFAACWFALVLLTGMPWKHIGAMIGGGLGGLGLAYAFYDNARHRIDSFIGGGTAYDQVDLASRTLEAGGWLGSGLWLGVRKMSLPEAHTDYIFSVIGEEFGLLTCAVIVAVYLAIVLRVLSRLVEEEDLFRILAATGLVTLFGGQAFINILVNLQLFPSKGMTLPLVSYGGSSTIAVCFGIGLLLALTRRNPYLQRDRVDFRNMITGGKPQ
ncbi:FtsW/RodA/SpoVE family cell cycle protein [Altererythrobacter sp. CAU 1778]